MVLLWDERLGYNKTMSIKEDLAERLIQYLLERSVTSLADKNHRFLKLLEMLKIAELKDDFDSVYTHALVKYSSADIPEEWVRFFAGRPVKDAFKQDYLSDSPHTDNLAAPIHLFLEKEKLPGWFKRLYPDVPAFSAQIRTFRQIFDDMTDLSRKPSEAKMYFELNRQILILIEEKDKKSFPYQVEQYLARLEQGFYKEFLERGFYIDLDGETRLYQETGPVHGEYPAGETTGMLKPTGIDRDEERPEGEDRYQVIAHVPLDTLINQWLADENHNLLVIIGEYGTGKTTFCRHLAQQLAAGRLGTASGGAPLSVRDEKNRIPLYFPLRDFEKTVDAFIVNRLNTAGVTDIDFPTFQDRLKKGEFIVILDGFDEMTQKIDADEKSRNFDKLCRLIDHSPQSKVILTVRQEYFRTRSDFDTVFRCRLRPQYEFVYLRPFTDDQIQQYLSGHTDDPDYYWQQINEIFDLHDLARRPVLLQLIVDYLPALIREKGRGRPIKSVDLYGYCLQDELRRKNEALSFTISNQERLQILEKLALRLYLTDALSFDVMLLEKELNLREHLHAATDWEFEKHINEFLTFTFLIREGDNRFRLSHKSFRDYLAARHFTDAIDRGQSGNFGRVLVTAEVSRFMFELGPRKERLLALVETARDLVEENQWQGSNAANILLQLDKSGLKGKNLAGCRLRRVNFEGCDLTATDLTGADLAECLFDKNILSARVTGVQLENAALDLSYTGITDLPPLSDLTQLKELWLSHNQITDLSPLRDLRQLKELSLWGNQITGLTPLSDLRQLKALSLGGNQIADLSPLSDLRQLKRLSLWSNQIADLSPLRDLRQLSDLRLENNQIADLSPLRDLRQLSDLRLKNNQIVDLSPLKDLSQLTWLELDQNQIADLSPLRDLSQLTWLGLRHNQIVDLSPLRDLSQLTWLGLRHNQIVDLSPLYGLQGLKHIWLDKNPLAEGQIQALQAALPNLTIIR